MRFDDIGGGRCDTFRGVKKFNKQPKMEDDFGRMTTIGPLIEACFYILPLNWNLMSV